MTLFDAVKKIAPTIATALGGPVAGVAVKYLSEQWMGKPGATEDEIADQIALATPEQLVKLKELDIEFKLRMEELGIEYDKVIASDRADARKRQSDMNDWTPNIIGIMVIIGYFAALFYSLCHPSKELDIYMARLQDSTIIVLSYFFGAMFKKRKDN